MDKICKLKLAEIKLDNRFRKKFEGIAELAKSIEQYGQFVPIIIDENKKLIAGERRLKAHEFLKLETINCIYLNDLDDITKKEIEFEENIQRRNFTWQEEINAKAEIHKLKTKIYGKAIQGGNKDGWTAQNTAIALDISTGSLSMDLQLVELTKTFPELLSEKTKSVALKKGKEKKERLYRNALSKKMEEIGMAKHPNIINGDCVLEMRKMDAESIDLIIADPPYGIDIANAIKYRDMEVIYNDNPYDIANLIAMAFEQMFRVLKMDTHIYVFSAAGRTHITQDKLSKAGFDVHAVPLIWDKIGTSRPGTNLSFSPSYEAFVFATKGKRKLIKNHRDIFSESAPKKRIHPTEKPTALLRELIKLSSDPGQIVLDPFAGSGSTLQAALETQRKSIGIEKDTTYYQRICERLKELEG